MKQRPRDHRELSASHNEGVVEDALLEAPAALPRRLAVQQRRTHSEEFGEVLRSSPSVTVQFPHKVLRVHPSRPTAVCVFDLIAVGIRKAER